MNICPQCGGTLYISTTGHWVCYHCSLNKKGAAMAGQPKPMGVQTMEALVKDAACRGLPGCKHCENTETLIAAVRAECRAVNPCERKCVDFCNAYETGKSEERARVLAEFRKLAENHKWPSSKGGPYDKMRKAIRATIQSLET